MKNKSILLLIFILLVAVVLRLWQLGSVPVSPDWDEVALGYNAYSILHTGRDEYGKFLPVALQSFGDYKPAVYAYLAVPSVALFGLNTFAVRLPSALLGIIAVFATYFLVKELLKRKDLALVSSALLAISPWHIQFSRIAFEANVGLTFNILIALFFLKGLKKPYYLLFAGLLTGLNPSVYQSERVFTPLFVFALIIIFRKSLLQIQKKYLISAVVITCIAAFPLLQFIATNNNALTRATGVSVFSHETQLVIDEREKLLQDKSNKNYLGELLHNSKVVYGKEITEAYLSHFSVNWLFLTGDMPRHHVPGMGLLYLWELPFLLIGIYSLFFTKFETKAKVFIIAWFLLAPIPASVTFDVPHAVRTLNFLPIFQIFIALGIITSYTHMAKYKGISIRYKGLVYALSTFYFLLSTFYFVYYLNQYFVQQNYFYSQDWQYGYKEAINTVSQTQQKYSKIVVSNAVPLDQSYIFFLFYLQYPPQNYQHEQKTDGANHSFLKYVFRSINWDKEKKTQNILYVGRPEDFPDSVKKLKTINYLNGKPAIVMVEG